jgi:hypothetical protein
MNWAIELSRKYIPRDGQADLFGVIVYTDHHVHIRKLLEDDGYWRALDEWSGPRWAIFATRAAQGQFTHPPSSPGVLATFVQIWKEPIANKQLLDAFQLSSTEDLPTLVLFIEQADGGVLSRAVKIDDASRERAYESLKGVLAEISSSLDFMHDENRRIKVRAFDVASERISQHQEWQSIKNVLGVLDVIGRLKKLLS